MDERAIVKFVNYQTSTPGRARRLSKYLRQLTRTEAKYIASQYMSTVSSEHSLEIIENRWHPKGTRMFKQGILSFGASCTELETSKALEVTKEVLEYFDSYPWLAAVHINKPEHVHAHFLLGMTNICNGKKYSQGPAELQQFREHYDKVARQHSLPTLERQEIQQALLPSNAIPEVANYVSDAEGGDEDVERVPWYYSPPPAMQVNESVPAPMVLVDNPLRIFGDRFREDFAVYFNFGYRKG